MQLGEHKASLSGIVEMDESYSVPNAYAVNVGVVQVVKPLCSVFSNEVRLFIPK